VYSSGSMIQGLLLQHVQVLKITYVYFHENLARMTKSTNTDTH